MSKFLEIKIFWNKKRRLGGGKKAPNCSTSRVVSGKTIYILRIFFLVYDICPSKKSSTSCVLLNDDRGEEK